MANMFLKTKMKCNKLVHERIYNMFSEQANKMENFVFLDGFEKSFSLKF